MPSSPSERRRRIVGLSMIASATLSLATAVILPANRSDLGDQVASVAAHPDRFVAATLVALLSLILLVPALLGLVHMLRDRAPRLALVGGGLGLAGVMPVAVQIALGLVEWQMVTAGAERTQMVALLNRIEFSAGFVPILFAAALPALGLCVLGAGLWRTRLTPRWIAVLLGAGAVALDLGFELPSLGVRILAAALSLLAFAYLGRTVRGWSAEEWRAAPER